MFGFLYEYGCEALLWLGWCFGLVDGAKPWTMATQFFPISLCPLKSKVTFNWEEPAIVGNTFTFVVEFYRWTGRPYPISDFDGVLIEIKNGETMIGASVEIGGTNEEEINTVRCHFSPRKSGEYKIFIDVNGTKLLLSPYIKKFYPADPDPSQFSIIRHTSTVICSVDIPHYLLIEPRDVYQNVCVLNGVDNFSITVKNAESGSPADVLTDIAYGAITKRFQAELVLDEPGCFNAVVSYNNTILPDGKFDIIVLTAGDMSMVQSLTRKKVSDGFECDLITVPVKTKQRKVYCFITPKILYINEYFFSVIPRRIATFRLCPSTKLTFKPIKSFNNCITIEEDGQPKISISSPRRFIIAALFSQYMLKRIGGSESFSDKQAYFYHEVRKHHSKKEHSVKQIPMSRTNLVESSMSATRYFTPYDWCKKFEIHFTDEDMYDWGGIRREWMDLLCDAMFNPCGKLFTTLHEGSQALVLPNANRPSHLKLKHYEFAGKIVGKCVYESALGSDFAIPVRAKFAKSFLAQLIRLRVHYKHFSSDDPELYGGMINHILNNNVSHFDDPLYFVDDVLEPNGRTKSVELIPKGSDVQVTEENKYRYLHCLAQFRLSASIKPEIEAFLTGLNMLIPDHLLCIFDENELELLICGLDKYSVSDLRMHHILDANHSDEFKQTVKWFWAVVSNFTDEEMARLLQFTTGCSRLPPGGFSQLTPRFQICSLYSKDRLPIAHTCFNQLSLHTYTSYEMLEKSLLTAITEGSEGFNLTP